MLTQTTERRFFPALLGALHQELAEGELILEQNDGTRRAFWEKGNLIYLQSDAAGEQFGNYLIRQGVLDREALEELLSASEDTRFGDRVVQWGLVSTEERDRLLQRLLEQILLNALEHPVVNVIWEPGPIKEKLSADLRFHLDHRPLIWETFQQIRDLTFLVDLLYSESAWRWSSKEDLLVSLSDLPLTTDIAFALSLLGNEPMGYESFMSVTGMEEDDAARLIVALWALGSLSLIEGRMPTFPFPKERRKKASGSSNFSTGQMPLVVPSAPPPAQHDPLPRPAPRATPSVQAAPAPPPPPPMPQVIPVSWAAAPAPPPPPHAALPGFSAPTSQPNPDSDPVLARPYPGFQPPLPMQPATFEPPLPRPSQSSVWGLLPEQETPPIPRAHSIPPSPPPSTSPEPRVEDPAGGPEILLALPEGNGGASADSPVEQARKFLKKAKILLIQGRTGEAVRALEDSVRLDPDSRSSFEAWLMLGKLRLSNPAWTNRAVEALQMATRVNPLVAEPWALMGELYLKKEFKANAISCFKKALELDPSVAIPKDIDIVELSAPPAASSLKGDRGLMGRIKGLFS